MTPHKHRAKQALKPKLFSWARGRLCRIPEPSGPGTAIIVNDTPYLVDLGTGVVRPAAACPPEGVLGLDTVARRIGFITHLHSDHTLGLPDVMLTPWIVGRKEPLAIKRIPAAIRRAQMSAGKQEGKSNC